jgi:hypothetical protein
MIYESRRQQDTDNDHGGTGTAPLADGDYGSPADHNAGPGVDTDAAEPGAAVDGLRGDSAIAERPADAGMAQDAPPGAPTREAPNAVRQASAGHPEPVWTAEQVAQFQQRWQGLQVRFVDDPRAVAEEATALVGEAVDQLFSAVTARRQQLDAWRAGGENGEATEQMRIAVRSYRYLLDRLLAS